MAQILIIIATLLLGYGLGISHLCYLYDSDKEFIYSWYNPLLYPIIITTSLMFLFTKGPKHMISELKLLIKEINE